MFHLKDGWFFERLEDGSVRISIRGFSEEVVATPNEWASVVASVSSHGDFNPFYQQALDFHGGLTKRALDGAKAPRKSKRSMGSPRK